MFYHLFPFHLSIAKSATILLLLGCLVLPSSVTAQLNGTQELHFYEHKGNSSEHDSITGLILRAEALSNNWNDTVAMDSAISISAIAVNLSRINGYKKELVNSLIILANGYQILGLAQKALQHYQEALAVAEEAGFMSSVEILCGNIAGVYQAQDKYERSLIYYYKAIKVLEQSFSISRLPETAHALVVHYYNLAAVMERLYDYDQALQYIDRAERIARVMNYMELVYIVYAKADILNQAGAVDAAEIISEQAMQLATRKSPKDIRQNILQLKGDIAIKKGDTSAALNYYRAIDQRYLTALDNILLYYSLGKLYCLTKKDQMAEMYLLKALSASMKYDARKFTVDICEALSSLYVVKADYRKAAVYSALARPLKDSLTNVEKSRMIYTLEMKYRTAEKDRRIVLNDLIIARQNIRLINRNVWIAVLSVGITGVLFFLLFYAGQKRKFYKQEIMALKQNEKVNVLLAVTSGEESERKRIAHDLHDGIGGLLSNLKLYFSRIQKKQPALQQNDEYHEALQLLDQALTEVRKTAHNLMPELLLTHGLPEAVRMFCSSVQKLHAIKMDFQYYGFIGRLNPKFELFVYRIVQELIQNILKHSNADTVLIQLSLHENILDITVEDNGIGIATNFGRNGMGLTSIQSRIRDLNGDMIIRSEDHGGTSVFIEFDLQKQEILTHEH